MAEPWTEAEIAALLDGELDGAEKARIEWAVETDPAARACAARIRETDALLREAFAAPLSEATHAAMVAVLSDEPVVTPFRPRRSAPSRWTPAALAASVALVVGAAAGAFLSPLETASNRDDRLAVGRAPQAIAAALETAPSGAVSGGVRPLASFPLPDGSVCREFEIDDVDGPIAFGLACRAAGSWRVLLTADLQTSGDPAESGFAPASGVAVDAAVVILDALGAGGALDPDAEARAIRSGWR